MKNTRTYIAITSGHNEFEFESEHRAGSAANMADAEAASRRKFGHTVRIMQTYLSDRDNGGPVAQPTMKNLDLSPEEVDAIRAAFADGRLTRAYMGAKVDGITAFADIKKAHGWSWSEFQRAIENIQ